MKTLSQKVYNAILLLFVIGLFGCGGGGGTNEGGGENNGGGANEIPPRTTSTQYLLHFAQWDGAKYNYIDENRITNVPPNTDFERWAVEQTVDDISLYFFKSGTGNTIRHFPLNRNTESFEYKRDYTIVGAPADAKFGKFGASRGTLLYLQSQSNPTKFYLFTYDSGQERYEYDDSSYQLANIPSDADLNRWGVTTDALGFTFLYTFQEGSNTTVYEFKGDLFNPRTLVFSDTQIISGIPSTADFSDFGTSGVTFSMNFIETNTTEIICGREGERACKITERIPSCDAGLVEDFMTQKCVKE